MLLLAYLSVPLLLVSMVVGYSRLGLSFVPLVEERMQVLQMDLQATRIFLQSGVWVKWRTGKGLGFAQGQAASPTALPVAKERGVLDRALVIAAILELEAPPHSE